MSQNSKFELRDVTLVYNYYLTNFMTSRGRDGRLEAESVEATDSVPIVLSPIVNKYKTS